MVQYKLLKSNNFAGGEIMNRIVLLIICISVLTIITTACSKGKNPIIQIEMQDGSKMKLELYPKHAPKTVENFVSLVEDGFYDGLTFHRIMEGFMIQGGDPSGDGTGGSEKTIKGEFSINGFNNELKHTKGVISMARSTHPDSASSQFFIMHSDVPGLDGQYAAFGKLIDGEDTLDKLAKTPVKPNPMTGEVSVPVEEVVIKSITLIEK